MPDPSPDTPSVYAPRCGHHGNPLTWLGDDHRWRCPDCFPELFPATPTAPGSSSPDTAALVAELREVFTDGPYGSREWDELIQAGADALEAQEARITELEAAVAERNSLIGWLIMAKSCADHGQAPVWPLPAQLEELFQQLSVTMRDDWDDWR